MKDTHVLTRRGFVTGSVATAAACAFVAGTESRAFAAQLREDVEFGADYDVVVIGFGVAGATAAITAADAGAKVLIVEKAPRGQEGGDSIFSGQVCMGVDAEYTEDLVKYFIAMGGNYQDYDEECFRAMAEGCVDNYDWLVSMGADGEKLKVNLGEEGYRSPGSGFFWTENPWLEGAGHNIGWVVNAGETVSPLYYLLHENVDKRENIDVWYASPAKHLIKDAMTNAVIGVQVEREGNAVNILARNGVVMALGGYEHNQKMIGSYLQRAYCYPVAAIYNDGDGVKIAIEAGADLWHMSNSAGFIWGFKEDEWERAIYISPFRLKAGIMVGPAGTRFLNEAANSRHGRIDFGGSSIQTPCPDPTYWILDADSIAATNILGCFGGAGNARAIDKGWFQKAETVEELAAGIGCDAETLQKTIDVYNAAYDNGTDADYGRPANTVVPMRTAPYYYMKLVPTMYNTQGGARRNKDAAVVDIDGNAIPHLFSAGDFGAIWPDMYNGSGNIGECVVFGRIAGNNAAAAKDDVDLSAVTINDLDIVDEEPDWGLAENEYVGTGHGKGGYMKVKVAFDGDAISDITILRLNETVGQADEAIAQVPAAIIAANSVEVDGVTGATRTSNAIKEAVADALAQAGK
ncbi:MAG: FAD-binding protein [Coriobacteriales bacterium]|nr:FAD-binding protein [Coriobacteriales bacterium]